MAAKVSLKSTKQEILDALHAAEKELKERKSVLAAPAAEAEKAKSEEVVQAAAADVESGIFSDEMNEKYQNLMEAIRLQEEKLKNYYDIDAALLDMTQVINAKKQALMNMDAELEQAKKEAKAATEALSAEAKALSESLNADNARLKNDLATARKREQAEYEYDLSRARKQEADEHADKMAVLAKQAAEAEEKLKALRADADAIAALQARVDGLPEELDAKYQEGFKDGEKAAGKEYGYKNTMAEKEHAYELRERDGKIERLEREITEKADKIASLEAKLDAAYAQLRDLATKTVESSGGLKVISTATDSNSGRK